MSNPKNPGRRATVTIDLTRLDDLADRFGARTEGRTTFDINVPDGVSTNDAIGQITGELTRYLSLVLDTSDANRRIAEALPEPSATAVSSRLEEIEGPESDDS